MLVLVAAALLLWFDVVVTAAAVFRPARPDYALRLAGFDGFARAAEAQNILTSSQAPAARAAARASAVAALAREPTAIDAVTTLGLLASLEGDQARAERSFRYAERLTRRDPASQLWLIQQRVDRNDIEGALAQYDTALRGSSALRDQLYPILLSASADPAIARPLNRLLRRRPNWWSEFLTHLVAEERDAGAMVTVSRGLLDPQIPDQRQLLAIMFSRLLAQGRYDQAWGAYEVLPGTAAAASAPLRDGNFARDVGLAPFDWDYATDSELAPERRLRDGTANAFALYLPTGAFRDSDVASQMLRLAPGPHQLSLLVGDTGAGPARPPYVKLVCVTGDTEILVHPLPAAGPAGIRTTASFLVPADCRYQRISIGVRAAPDGEAGATPWVADLRVR